MVLPPLIIGPASSGEGIQVLAKLQHVGLQLGGGHPAHDLEWFDGGVDSQLGACLQQQFAVGSEVVGQHPASRRDSQLQMVGLGLADSLDPEALPEVKGLWCMIGGNYRVWRFRFR
ncbi:MULTISPECIES: hypothetical protein [Rhodococcus]|uniref:hypothetical protein n=1 Tax=Rhodococcus TaxID=1827 RepID=UPI00193AFE9B|nr:MULTISPECIES: hypothetical protein [Rhodococcus]QRI75059.1 hypothetical protein JQ505_21300 [Rhodococcus aetherivorans]QSE58468.1 hypothetical protein JYA75_22405 [Rhodococcus sp. PSBB066]QSE70208.1 hypothetical protein JYA91_05215 [Rhodococcus sp. PSBB049]